MLGLAIRPKPKNRTIQFEAPLGRGREPQHVLLLLLLIAFVLKDVQVQQKQMGLLFEATLFGVGVEGNQMETTSFWGAPVLMT